MPDAPLPDPLPDATTTLVCLHWLGGSSRTWDAVTAALGPDMDVLALDLPGFGDAAHLPGVGVEAMADAVAAHIAEAKLDRWMLAGHSMGAKVALALARRAEDGAAGLDGLSRLILLAGSPPAAEPMAESRRETMLGWFRGDQEQSRAEAQTLIDGAVGAPLDPATNAHVLEDILRLSRQAWAAWLEEGSREDWADRIGILNTPALVVAGGKDADLGPDGQKHFMLRHLAEVELVVMDGAGHLLPVERPQAIAHLIADRAESARGSLIPPHYRAFMQSDRVAARTRALLVKRGAPDDPQRHAKAMSETDLATLRALVDRILPQPEPRIDIAARIDEGLATTPGDGWRFVDLPSDQESYRRGLATVDRLARDHHGGAFVSLDPEQQDALIGHLPAGKESSDAAGTSAQLGPHQMALWFEDLCANIVRVYMSHPLALARIGYSGIGYGGDGERLQGFTTVGLGGTEPWEPKAMEPAR